MLRRVDYMVVQDVVSVHYDFTNIATNISRVSVDEINYRNMLSQNSRKEKL